MVWRGGIAHTRFNMPVEHCQAAVETASLALLSKLVMHLLSTFFPLHSRISLPENFKKFPTIHTLWKNFVHFSTALLFFIHSCGKFAPFHIALSKKFAHLLGVFHPACRYSGLSYSGVSVFRRVGGLSYSGHGHSAADTAANTAALRISQRLNTSSRPQHIIVSGQATYECWCTTQHRCAITPKRRE